MDKEERAARARAVLQDEILHEAVNETLTAINRSLLAARTPEEREQRWQEYHSLKRAFETLKRWPLEAEQ